MLVFKIKITAMKKYLMEVPKKGVFNVLLDYRDQGIIKAWGVGVNKIRAILNCIETANPDTFFPQHNIMFWSMKMP
jgi:aryl-alcohol dehydrogenase-like predicted oxidoreductase